MLSYNDYSKPVQGESLGIFTAFMMADSARIDSSQITRAFMTGNIIHIDIWEASLSITACIWTHMRMFECSWLSLLTRSMVDLADKNKGINGEEKRRMTIEKLLNVQSVYSQISY